MHFLLNPLFDSIVYKSQVGCVRVWVYIRMCEFAFIYVCLFIPNPLHTQTGCFKLANGFQFQLVPIFCLLALAMFCHVAFRDRKEIDCLQTGFNLTVIEGKTFYFKACLALWKKYKFCLFQACVTHWQKYKNISYSSFIIHVASLLVKRYVPIYISFKFCFTFYQQWNFINGTLWITMISCLPVKNCSVLCDPM